MPTDGYRDDRHWHKYSNVRARIRAELLAKGLYEGGSKYNEVMSRKLRKAQQRGEC